MENTKVNIIETKFNDIIKSFSLSTDEMRSISESMVHEMNQGLQSEYQMLAMIPSYVTSLPTTVIDRKVLALDFGISLYVTTGGTNFRICRYDLKTDNSTCLSKAVPEYLKDPSSTAEELFNFFAKSVEDFLIREGVREDHHVLGFTFSFAIKQTSINSGTLLGWSKGFLTTGVIDHDPVKLLDKAFKKRELHIDITALVNDSVGTLVSHAYKNKDSFAAIILGTGTNAAYLESQEQIRKQNPRQFGKEIINVEWANFGRNAGEEVLQVLKETKYDTLLNSNSENKNYQTFEKMTSGKYLGEISRLAIIDLLNLNGSNSKFTQLFVFETAQMSLIEGLKQSEIVKFFNDEFKLVMNEAEADMIKKVCAAIGTRSSRLIASSINALLVKNDALKKKTSIGIDGSVYEKYTGFQKRLSDALLELGLESVTVSRAVDGSGIGAALIAALNAK